MYANGGKFKMSYDVQSYSLMWWLSSLIELVIIITFLLKIYGQFGVWYIYIHCIGRDELTDNTETPVAPEQLINHI